MLGSLATAIQEALIGRCARDLLTAKDKRAFNGQRVLVTGAGGSVGSELARQIAACGPERLTLYDHSEYHLFRVERELAERWPDVVLDPILGDVTRVRSIAAACRLASPHVVYHAAAYKHVTMTERAVCAAVQANVFGTWNAARAAGSVGARFVLISSDKAAQPESVMGATKRLAELVTLAHTCSAFRPVAVRFGNILGSSGSVVEVMLSCIQAGRPIPITHPDATRYFMTAAEAVSLVLKADLMGRGGEIYWLDMGAPVRIADLAHRLLAVTAEAGFEPVPIQLVGLRPGEKLREELTTQGLELCRTTHPRILVARQPGIEVAKVRRVLRALRDDVHKDDALSALADLCAAVPEYQPSHQAWESAAAKTVGTSASVSAPEARVA